jgi:hypothetical protein
MDDVNGGSPVFLIYSLPGRILVWGGLESGEQSGMEAFRNTKGLMGVESEKDQDVPTFLSLSKESPASSGVRKLPRNGFHPGIYSYSSFPLISSHITDAHLETITLRGSRVKASPVARSLPPVWISFFRESSKPFDEDTFT